MADGIDTETRYVLKVRIVGDSRTEVTDWNDIDLPANPEEGWPIIIQSLKDIVKDLDAERHANMEKGHIFIGLCRKHQNYVKGCKIWETVNQQISVCIGYPLGPYYINHLVYKYMSKQFRGLMCQRDPQSDYWDYPGISFDRFADPNCSAGCACCPKFKEEFILHSIIILMVAACYAGYQFVQNFAIQSDALQSDDDQMYWTSSKFLWGSLCMLSLGSVLALVGGYPVFYWIKTFFKNDEVYNKPGRSLADGNDNEKLSDASPPHFVADRSMPSAEDEELSDESLSHFGLSSP